MRQEDEPAKRAGEAGYQCPTCKAVFRSSWQAQEHSWRSHGFRLPKPKAVAVACASPTAQALRTGAGGDAS